MRRTKKEEVVSGKFLSRSPMRLFLAVVFARHSPVETTSSKIVRNVLTTIVDARSTVLVVGLMNINTAAVLTGAVVHAKHRNIAHIQSKVSRHLYFVEPRLDRHTA